MSRPLANLSMCSLAAVAGCGLLRPDERLERVIDLQEQRIGRLESQLAQAEHALQASRSENQVLRQQLAAGGAAGILPEQAAAVFTVHEITLNRFLTGGVNTDGLPGDDALSVLVTPLDFQRDTIKAPGRLQIGLLDLSRDEPDRELAVWQFDLDQALACWESGVFGSGYRFELPWNDHAPQAPDLLVHARLTTPDGRQFDTVRPIRIELSGAAPRLPGPTLREASTAAP